VFNNSETLAIIASNGSESNATEALEALTNAHDLLKNVVN